LPTPEDAQPEAAELEEEEAVLEAEKCEFEHSQLRRELTVTRDVVEAPVAAPIPLYRPAVKIGPQDFELLKVIGMGAFGKVLQVSAKQQLQVMTV
jgi:hypothetical protein